MILIHQLNHKIQGKHVEISISGTNRQRDTQRTPTRDGLKHTSTLREDLHRWRPSEGEEILILVQPVIIADGSLEGEEIAVEVRRLWMEQAGVPSDMTA